MTNSKVRNYFWAFRPIDWIPTSDELANIDAIAQKRYWELHNIAKRHERMCQKTRFELNSNPPLLIRLHQFKINKAERRKIYKARIAWFKKKHRRQIAEAKKRERAEAKTRAKNVVK